jgi:cobalt/nickel transport system permease protein
VPLYAVHLSDGVLSNWYLVAGFVVAALLILPAVWRIDDDEIPRIGLLTAAFFVASSIRVPIGITHVHLLLNGLVGIVLGRRAPLAITIALVLQALLLGHGGYTTLGLNAIVMAFPALVGRGLFLACAGSPPVRKGRAVFAGSVVGASAVLLTAFLYSAVVYIGGIEDFRVVATLGFAVHLPLVVIEGLIVGVCAGYLAQVKPEMLGLTAKHPAPPSSNR